MSGEISKSDYLRKLFRESMSELMRNGNLNMNLNREVYESKIKNMSQNLIDLVDEESKNIEGTFYSSIDLGGISFPDYHDFKFYLSGASKNYFEMLEEASDKVGIPRDQTHKMSFTKAHIREAMKNSDEKQTVDAYIKSKVEGGKVSSIKLELGFKNSPFYIAGNVKMNSNERKIGLYLSHMYLDSLPYTQSKMDFRGLDDLKTLYRNEEMIYSNVMNMNGKKNTL